MSVDRLVKEFGAQDVGAFMVCFLDGKHTRVAQWIEGNNVWNILPEGLALLNPDMVESEVETAPKPKGLRKAKNAFAAAVEGDEDLS